MKWLTLLLRLVTHAGLALLVVYGVDFAADLSQASRLVLMIIATGYLLWRLSQLARPALASAEGIVDAALLLERQHELPGTLVAGLQFARGGNEGGRSQQLAAQVIDEAAAYAGKLDCKAVVPRDECRRQLLRCASVVGVIAFFGFLFPDHASAFISRLKLHDTSYPTQTQILSIYINSQMPDTVLRVVEGDDLAFVIRAAGRLPDSGKIHISSRSGDDAVTIGLARDLTITEPNDGSATYKAGGPNVTQDMTLSIEMGDARAGEFLVEVVRRPIVELSVVAKPPEYARLTLDETFEQERFVEALFGSKISFRLRCTNGKELRHAALESSSKSASRSADLRFVEAEAEWVLAGETPPLNPLTEEVEFSLLVRDEDGLSTSQPIEGAISVRPDQPPGGTVRTEYHFILPTAQPVIRYEASDDFGIAGLFIDVSRDRNGDETAEQSLKLPLDARENTPLLRADGELAIDFSQIALRDGDRVFVRLRVVDDRGEWPSASFTSEPVEIEIGNEMSVMKAILETDATTERLLTEAIEVELGLKNDDEP